MIIFKISTAVSIFFVMLFSTKAALSSTLIKVVDQHNTPLANVVIEYLPANIKFKKADPTENLKENSPPVYVMDQLDKAFVPDLLVIPKNSLVSFPNSDDIRHHVYSFSAAKTFELKLYAGQPKEPVLFNNEGLVVMGCNIHDAMVGYIYVSNNDDVFISNEEGEVLINTTLSTGDKLQLWHANAKAGIDNRTLMAFDKLLINNNEVQLLLPVNSPVERNSFEDLFSHAH
ncbi:hypothetical protein GCM10009111_12270 [Colwellia asteriadis]|uniref:Methylamine utilization protein n=1 Tax=Colwellia asteriadis TaxID=517723 RepID=A0ABN1L5W9_9GAMM